MSCQPEQFNPVLTLSLMQRSVRKLHLQCLPVTLQCILLEVRHTETGITCNTSALNSSNTTDVGLFRLGVGISLLLCLVRHERFPSGDVSRHV